MNHERVRGLHTWQVPWLALVEVCLADGAGGEARVGGLPGEVVRDELLVGGVEPKARSQLHLHGLMLLLVVVHVVCSISCLASEARRMVTLDFSFVIDQSQRSACTLIRNA
jgi:hypothetical protein